MIVFKKNENIGILSIERPEKLNALNRDIVNEMDTIIERIKEDEEVRCLIIYSEKNFAAGADIVEMSKCNSKEAEKFIFTATYDKLAALPIPTIAAIEGYALGGGLELAMTADMRIAGKSAKLGLPEVTLGICPGAGGTIRVPRVIGPALAKELIFTGDIITAERALEVGILNRIVEDNDVFEEALKIAKRIAKRAPIAVRLSKQLIDKGLELPAVEDGTKLEAQKWVTLFDTSDQKEGMSAFIEKRKPNYVNK